MIDEITGQIGWQRKVLDYYDARAFYTEGASAPKPLTVVHLPHRAVVAITWSDRSVTEVSESELTKVLTSKGGTGVGLGMEDWATPLVRTPYVPPNTVKRVYAELNCMWCNKMFGSIEALEVHEDECG